LMMKSTSGWFRAGGILQLSLCSVSILWFD